MEAGMEGTNRAESPYAEIAGRVTARSREFDDYARRLAKTREEVNVLSRETFLVREGAVHDQQLRFVGVAHAPETFLYHREALERSIENAGAIVLEGAPEIGGLYASETQARLEQERIEQGGSKKDIIPIHTSSDYEFFHEIEQLAKKYRKAVITLDPYSNPIRFLEDGVNRWEAETAFGPTDTALRMAGPATALAGVALNVRALKNAQASATKEADAAQRSKLSRRQFLAGMAASGVGAVLTARNYAADDPTSSIARPFAYDTMDYRNVAVAKGVDELTSRKSFPGPLTFIYGSNHADPIMQYLTVPGMKQLRDAKYAAYTRMSGLDPLHVSEFEFRAQIGEEGRPGWVKVPN